MMSQVILRRANYLIVILATLLASFAFCDDEQSYQAAPEPSSGDWKIHKIETKEGQTDLSYGNGTFFMIGQKGSCLKSFDAKTWQKVNLGVNGDLSTVCFGDGKWILGARSVLIHSFDNGNRWDGIRTKNWTFGIIDIQRTASGFLATGLRGDLMESTNGVDWKTVKSLGPTPLIGVANHDANLVCLGVRGRIYHTSAGNQSHWLRHIHGKNVLSVCYGNGKFVAVGREGSVVVKNEAKDDWETVNTGETHDFYRVKFIDSTFYGLGDKGTLITSADGVAWEKQDVGTTLPLRDICFDGRSIFILASTGRLLSRVVHPNVTPKPAKDSSLDKQPGGSSNTTNGQVIKKIFHADQPIEPKDKESCVHPRKFTGAKGQHLDYWTFRVAEILGENETLLAFDTNGNSTYFVLRASSAGLQKGDLVRVIGALTLFNRPDHRILSREDPRELFREDPRKLFREGIKFTPIVFLE